MAAVVIGGSGNGHHIPCACDGSGGSVGGRNYSTKILGVVVSGGG